MLVCLLHVDITYNTRSAMRSTTHGVHGLLMSLYCELTVQWPVPRTSFTL